jgi:CPA2 family monovalent cation:H+ antiporter-2
MDITILETILSVFFAALLVTVVFRQLHLPVILGYLLVGAIVGPHAIGLVPDSQYIKNLAEFGIVLLMFTIGLNFSLPKLFALRFSVFVVGGLQVLLTILITTLTMQFIGMAPLPAIVIGCIAAMSSTAIVVKQLQDQRELYTPHGLSAIGVLLFQDLAVIPFIILIPSIHNTSQHNLALILFWALVKGILAILLIFTVGRWLLRPLFHLIAKTRAIELFTLMVLMVTLTSAWLTHTLGLSFALGAFLAGIMLAETEFRHQIEIEIRPFRDILLGLFFITIGMLTNISAWHLTWTWILLMLGAIVVVKMAVVTIVSRVSGSDGPTSLRTGLILAQGSEFGFALLTLALSNDVLPADYGQVILAALLISIAFSPALIYFNKSIAAFFFRKTTRAQEKISEQQVAKITKKRKHHVIICGYGRVGQHIARLLDKINFPYVGVDIDSRLIQNASLAGDHVIYGDPAHPQILKAAGIDQARVLVISFNDLRATIKILSLVKNSYPKLPTLVRCRDEAELKQLKEYGATEIIAELFEESLTLSHHLLHLIDVPSNKTAELISEIRRKDYALLQKVFTSSFDETENNPIYEELMPILVPTGAYAVDRSMDSINLTEMNIELIGIRRGHDKYVKPSKQFKLQPNDIIIVYGKSADLEKAERRILDGN